MGWRSLAAALLGTTLLAGACSGDDDSDDSGRSAAASGCGREAAPQPAAGENVFRFEGRAASEMDDQDAGEQATQLSGQEISAQERAYLLALPEDYDDELPQPLILNLHGAGSDKESHERDTDLAQAAVARGYVVVTPDTAPEGETGGDAWSILGESEGTDFVVLDALVTELRGQLCLDADRVYLVGHGAGALFAGFFGCWRQEAAAVALVSGLVPPTCEPERTPSVVAIQGTADPSAPYEGGDVGIQVPLPGVLDTLGFYAEHYGCEEPATQDEVSVGVSRQQLVGCPHGEMDLYTIQDGDGSWPVAGPEGDGLDATTTILDFFDDHPG